MVSSRLEENLSEISKHLKECFTKKETIIKVSKPVGPNLLATHGIQNIAIFYLEGDDDIAKQFGNSIKEEVKQQNGTFFEPMLMPVTVESITIKEKFRDHLHQPIDSAILLLQDESLNVREFQRFLM